MVHDLATPNDSSVPFLIDFLKLFLVLTIGILMEEADNAVEFLWFGFKIQHYGSEESKYIVTFYTLDDDECVFSPMNESVLDAATKAMHKSKGKRVFMSCDKQLNM